MERNHFMADYRNQNSMRCSCMRDPLRGLALAIAYVPWQFFSATEAAPRTTAAPIHIIQSDAAPVFGEVAADEEELLLEELLELLPPLLLPVSATMTTGDRLANLAVTVLAAASKLDFSRWLCCFLRFSWLSRPSRRLRP